MTEVEDNAEQGSERRNEKRVTYTSILGFKELKGQKVPPNPPRPNATGMNLSLNGICFHSKKRPQTEHVVLYLPDGARAVVRVANITRDPDSLEYTNHCDVVRWLPDNVTTLEALNPEPEPEPWPVPQTYE